MSKKFKVIVNTGNANNNEALDVTQGQGGRGQPVRIKAKAGAKYQLLDLEKAKAVGPDLVKVKRVGKNFHIQFDGSTEADVIIEDYFDVMPEGYNALIGQAESGIGFEYVIESPEGRRALSTLLDGGGYSPLTLGGSQVVAVGSAIGTVALNPVVTSLLATTGALAGSQIGGGGSGGSGESGSGGSGGTVSYTHLTLPTKRIV